MDELEKVNNKYKELKEKNDNLIHNLNNYINKLRNEIDNIKLILEKQPFTILRSEDYYKGQEMEKRKVAITINSILAGEWNIDESGNIIEISKTKMEEL